MSRKIMAFRAMFIIDLSVLSKMLIGDMLAMSL